MNDENKIYYPETTDDVEFPLSDIAFDSSEKQKTSNETYKSVETPMQSFPTRKIAFEVIGQALNTKSRKILAEFEFTQYGAIQIGKYVNGVSGDVRITPSGMTARDTAGLTSFALDVETGSAVFRGQIQSGALITGIVSVGDDNIVIDGEARRMVWYDENKLPVISIGNG